MPTMMVRLISVTLVMLASCRHKTPSPLELVEPSAIRADWKTLPVVARPGESETLASHDKVFDDPETDERAPFGPFDLRWHERGYHSAPREWVDPVVCIAPACADALHVWEGSGGIYRRVTALRHDTAADVWYVSFTETKDETLAIVFKRH